MANGREERNIVMFPFMAHGHLNPFMALARELERKEGYTITIVNTPLNIQRLKSSLPSQTNIRLAEIPLNGTKYGLPPDAENTDTLSHEFMGCFLEASENLISPFKNLLIDITRHDGRDPVCIISDMFLGWTVKVANELGIYHTVFIAGAGYSMAIYFSTSLNIHQSQTDDQEFLLPDFPEASKIQKSRLGIDLKFTDGTNSWWRFRSRQFSLCLCSDAILLNTIKGLGDIGVKYFSRKMGGKPIWMIGPTCSYNQEKRGEKLSSKTNSCSEWLDLHPPASVLYVSFGSYSTILPSQMMELALGLEASNKPFIWVIRPPYGFNITEEFRAKWLPLGFEERINEKNQGLLVHKWAPQQEILSHKSTGAFLSHCGWNSVLESLSQGVPIIGWPLAGEQCFNSQMLENEVGVCIEVARGVDSATVKHDEVARVIKVVLGKTEKGEEMRKKAYQMKEKMEDALRGGGLEGSSIKAINDFLGTATSIKKSSLPSDLSLP
ncbi:UDP-glycosyltransferase 92A1-like [Fagus crenata]